MDRAQEAIERARASEQTLFTLRQELESLEASTRGPSLAGAVGGTTTAARAPVDNEPLSILGTSIDDLSRLHEQHASTMRHYGMALSSQPAQQAGPSSSSFSSSQVPPPWPSAEPTIRRDTAAALASRDVERATHMASAAAARDRLMTGSAPSLGALGARPAFDRPLGASSDGPAATIPMQRPPHELREQAARVSARASAATEARYAQQAATARARVEAAAARQAQRNAYLLERDGAAADRALERLGVAAEAARQHQQPLPARPSSARASTSSSGGGAGGAGGGRLGVGGSGSGSGGLGSSGSGGLGGSSSARPVHSIRYPSERPRSAPKERARVTVPVPFSFEHRPKKETASERRLAEELEMKRQAMEVAAKESMRARDLPPSTAPGLYSEMVAEAEAASRERRQVRRTVPVPFSFSHRRTKEPRRSDLQAGEWQGMEDEYADENASAQGGGMGSGGGGSAHWYEKGQPVGARKSFRARDVPRSMSEPRWEIMRVQEAERRERVAQKALESAAKSKLPPRMQQHKENERARKAAEAERIQRELDAELTLRPAITPEVPDFDRLHLAFEKTLARKRNQYQPTAPQPFRMESEPYRMMQREVQQVRDEMIQRDIRRDELVMPERRWPYLSTQAPIGRKNVPDFKKEHQQWTEKAPNAGTTEKLEAHKRKIEEDNRRAAKERAKQAEEQRQRQQAQKQITKKVASRLVQVTGTTAKDVKAAAEEDAKRRKEELKQAWKDRKKQMADQMAEMHVRLDARPFLFEQASIDVAVERAKAEAHDKFDATLRKHGVGTQALADRLDP
jgi:hypothetical protein